MVVVLLGGGYATANAATVNDSTKAGNAAKAVQHAKGVAKVVYAAEAFLDTLSDDQKAEVLLPFTQANATAWSNLPCGSSCRPGMQFGTLSADQLTAAKKVVQAAMGTHTGVGYDQVMQILLADDVLNAAEGSGTGGTPPTGSIPSANPSATASADPSSSASATPPGAPTGTPPSGGAGDGGGANGGYGSGIYFMAFLGTPSVDGTWQLHFGGHHLAVNLAYRKGKVAGASPFFIGVEPSSWTAADGTVFAPLKLMRKRMLNVTASLSAAQLTQAKLAASFSDVLIGPGEDGQFPATKEGIRVSTLSHKQQKLVLEAIHPWVANVDDATAKQLMKVYKKELAQTYVGYSGGLGLDTQGDYVRIDGPSVWIEFVCQNGFVFQDQVHYHTVYRDHIRDYGGEFTF